MSTVIQPRSHPSLLIAIMTSSESLVTPLPCSVTELRYAQPALHVTMKILRGIIEMSKIGVTHRLIEIGLNLGAPDPHLPTCLGVNRRRGKILRLLGVLKLRRLLGTRKEKERGRRLQTFKRTKSDSPAPARVQTMF